jgi:MobA/MobL family
MATSNDLIHQPSDRLRQARATHQQILLRHQALATSGPSNDGSLSGTGADFERVEGKSDDAMGLRKGRVVKQQPRRGSYDKGQKVTHTSSRSDFSCPVTRDLRLETIDGRTSFHFDHCAISKTASPNTHASGRTVQSGSAKQHGSYIERDSAVADLATQDLELVASADKQRDRASPAGHDDYIARQEALAVQPGGSRVLFTNIDDDPTKREDYWLLTEWHERDSNPDTLTFCPSDNNPFWARALARADCPAMLREALLHGKPSDQITIETGGNDALRGWLSGIEGFVSIPPRSEGETNQVYGVRRARAKAFADFKDGRDGRVQYRVIGELPHELDTRARAAILFEFAQEFERRRLPFVAVMHAPDHANNDKNWHFHLVYHDRPARRVTAADIAQPPKDPNPRNTILTQLGTADIGRWDFGVEQTYLTSSRETRTRYPLRQKKLREVTRDTWVPMLRSRLADITNAQLELAGQRRRLDPRRLEDMGIEGIRPQEHLGTKAASLESMGNATQKGSRNEAKQWSALQKQIDGRFERLRAQYEADARKALSALQASEARDPRSETAANAIRKTYQLRLEAAEYEAIAQRADQMIMRYLSRATKVSQTCARYLQAIANGKASRRDRARVEDFKERKASADAFLTTADQVVSNDREFIRDCRVASLKCEQDATHLHLRIELGATLDEKGGAQNVQTNLGQNLDATRQARRLNLMAAQGRQM